MLESIPGVTMNDEDFSFSKLILRLRERRGWSLRRASAVAGVSSAYLSQLESGRAAPPSPRILDRLARAYEFQYEELMRAAGHLVSDTQEQVLRLGDRSYTLSELTPDDQIRLAAFLDMLTRRPQGNEQ